MKKTRVGAKRRGLRAYVMNRRLSSKLVFLSISGILLLFVVITTALVTLFEMSSREQLMKSNAEKLSDVNRSIYSIQLYLQGVADMIATADDLQDTLRSVNGGGVSEFFEQQPYSSKAMHILSTAYYSLDGVPIFFNSIDDSSGPLSQHTNPVYWQIRTGKATYVWQFIDQWSDDFMLEDNSPKLCLWRAVRANNDRTVIGMIAVTVDSRTLLGLGSDTAQNRPKVIILDNEGQALYDRGDRHLTIEDYSVLLANGAENHGFFEVSLDGTRYRVSYEKMQNTDFISYYLDDYASITWSFYGLYAYILITLLVFMVFLSLYFLYISKIVTRPLGILSDSMRQFASGDYSAYVNFKYQDEIGELGALFNDMVKENSRLIESEYKLTIRNKDAELSLLQSQINPHFLYNMLNTIYWKAIKIGGDEIADISNSMANMFRISLNRGNDITNVNQELQLITYYLKLQKVRFPNTLEYSFDFDQKALALQIPKLILQPLVENAIIHGANKQDGRVAILVKASLTAEGRLELLVKDTGPGIPEDILQHLLEDKGDNTELAAEGGSHYALWNINERFKLLYGNDYSFRFFNDNGANVEIVLPAHIPLNDTKKGGWQEC